MTRCVILGVLSVATLAMSPLKNASLTATRVGPIALGMTPAAISAVTHERLTTGGLAAAQCEYGKLSGAKGVNFTFSRGKLVRIDVRDKSIRTADGIGIGDSVARLKRVYRSRFKSSPGKYVAKNAEYDIASGKDNHLIIVTDGSRVTELRAGRVPEVYYVEGCS